MTAGDPALLQSASEGGLGVIAGLALAYGLAIVIGFFVLRGHGATIAGNELSLDRSVFSVINAATLGGFQQSIAVDAYAPAGRACIVGLMVLGTLFSLMAGGILVARVVGMPYSDWEIIEATVIWYVLAIFAGAAALADPQRGMISAAVQAASAFGNCGIVLGALPSALDPRTHLVLMPLAVLGSLSIPVLLDCGGVIFGRHRATRHSQVVLVMAAVLYLVGVAACLPWGNVPEAGGAGGFGSALPGASVMSIDGRTAGLPSVAVTSLSRIAQWLLIGLMLIGAAPGSAGGGLKTTTVYQLWVGLRRALRGETGLRITGIAATWALVYGGLVLATLLALLALQPELPGDRLLFLSVSAVSLVGFSQDPISMTGDGLLVLSAAMLLGRLLPLAILIWSAKTARGSDVAVG